jgi:uncharacterized membrane protein YtjA (UPF0391 family)
MLKWALIFFLISLVAGFFGFTGAAADFRGIAKILFFIALTACDSGGSPSLAPTPTSDSEPVLFFGVGGSAIFGFHESVAGFSGGCRGHATRGRCNGPCYEHSGATSK